MSKYQLGQVVRVKESVLEEGPKHPKVELIESGVVIKIKPGNGLTHYHIQDGDSDAWFEEDDLDPFP